MHDALKKIVADARTAFAEASSLDALTQAEVRFLGRKGELTELLRSLGSLDIEERKVIGAEANAMKTELDALLVHHRQVLRGSEDAAQMDREWIDVSLPGKGTETGHQHLTTHAIREIVKIFERLGYTRRTFPEIDWDFYAFESLNMPKDHPARDEWETFFVQQEGTHPTFGKMVLTPHTSNAQVREMQQHEPPLRLVNISKCYRRQSDITHVPIFHQFEGLLIDKNISITHLKGTLDHFVQSFFGPDRVSRLRPYHFRFTEPSFEVDVSCGMCHGTGLIDRARCRVCKEGWLELGGAGMVHPNVLRAGGLDPAVWGGFAFGFGVERSWMMKSGTRIDDIRHLYKNDLRFLEQF